MLNWQQFLDNTKLVNTGLLIDGNWISDRDQIDVINPADDKRIATVAKATTADVELAIDSAAAAFLKWKTTGVVEKSKVLRRWYELMLENLDDLAKLVTLECGKPLSEAQGEIKYAAKYLEWFSEELRRMDGDIIPANNPKQRSLVIKQPIGVCAAITPWNFPSAMLARKVGAAIAAGCTMIARPSSQTPLSALALGYLAIQAGLPNGAFNVINGDSELIATKLCQSNIVRKLTFTGSTAVGSKLYRESANTLKRLSLELGGNAPFIIFDDANLDDAVDGLIKSKFRNAGQTCVCANRVFVTPKIQDTFNAKLLTQIKQLKIGNGLDAGINVGPLINVSAIKHAKNLIEEALAKGARLVYGGEVHKLGHNFFTPTLLTNCTPDMRIFHEEIFAPIVAVYIFNTDAEVITLANDTPVGLASYFYTNDTKRVFRIAEALEYGIVGVNTGMISAENVPFGGIKHSGFGREGSSYGLDDYIDKKYICLDLS